MSSPAIARAVAKVMAEEPIDLSPPTTEQRQRTLIAIREQLARTAKERARRRWIFSAGAAAAVVLAVISTWMVTRKPKDMAANTKASVAPTIVAEEVHGAVFLATENGRVPLTTQDALANGQSIITGDGDTTIALRAGSRVRIDPSSDASVSEERGTELVHVKMGAVTAMVAKLLPTERFVVRTDEAEVEAHGTVFKVARVVQTECGARTSVHVVEGRISIRDAAGERFLSQSEDWMSPCAHPPSPVMSGSSTLPTLTPPASTQPSLRPPSLTQGTPTTPGTTPSLPERPVTTALPEPPTTAPTARPSVAPYPEFGRRK
jgi:hypothetical protein